MKKQNLAWIQTAIGLHQAGRLDEAEAAYTRALNDKTQKPDALRLLGALHLQKNAPDKAVVFLEQAAQSLPREAEVQNNLGIAHSRMGAVEKAIAHYTKAVQLNPRYAQAHCNRGRAYRALGDGATALDCFRKALEIKPDYTDAATQYGIMLAEGCCWDDAARCFESILARDSAHVPSWGNLGNVRRGQGRMDDAIACYQKALALQPAYAEAWLNLGTVLRDTGDLEGGRAAYDKALALRPGWVEALVNRSHLLQYFGDWDAALSDCNAALAHNPRHPDALWNKALIQLARGSLDEGFALYETGRGQADKRAPPPRDLPAWDGSPLNGADLLLWCEQGFGDSLQFIRYADACKAKGARITLLAPAPLARLFAEHPAIDRVITAIDDKPYAAQASLMSLPYLAHTTMDTIPAPIPYLCANADARAAMAGRIAGDGVKIGIVWAGAPRAGQLNAHLVDARRSMALDLWRPLLSVKNTRFFSLQMGDAAQALQDPAIGALVANPMDGVRDFMDTAALIEQLDLIIAVDTSIVHLAGAMGKPVWVLSRIDACWRWLCNRETNPWYPTARIFGQKQNGDWTHVIERIRAALTECAENGAPFIPPC